MKGDIFMKNKRKTGKKSSENNIVTNILPMIFKSLLIFSTVLLLSAMICYLTDINYDKYYLFLLASAVVSAFVSGLGYSRKKKKNGIVSGIISAVPIAVIILIFSLIATKGNVTVLLPVTMGSAIISGAVSGTLGVNIGR